MPKCLYRKTESKALLKYVGKRRKSNIQCLPFAYRINEDKRNLIMMMVWVFWYYNQKTFWIFNLNVRHLSYSCLSLLKHLGLLKAFKGLFLICLSTNWRICQNRWEQRQRRCYPLDVILDIWILKMTCEWRDLDSLVTLMLINNTGQRTFSCPEVRCHNVDPVQRPELY